MTSSRRKKNMIILVLSIGMVTAAVISGCNKLSSPPPMVDFESPADIWLAHSRAGFLCPGGVVNEIFPPLDMSGASGGAPEEGVLPLGDDQPAADVGDDLSPTNQNPSKLAGPFEIELGIPEGGDPNHHQPYVEANGAFSDQMHVDITGSTITISGPAPWATVSGTLNADGSFSATGTGTVAGRNDVTVSLTGSLTASGLTGAYELGLNGELPGGSITYNINGQKAPVEGTVISDSFDNSTGISTRWVDLDGDGTADVVRTYDRDGKFIDEKELDMKGVVTFSHYDASTGVEWKWVDTNNDGKPDVKRRYDRNGNLVEEQPLTGTVTSAVFDSSTGSTTEKVDTNGDGKPDTERKYDRDGKLIEEKPIQSTAPGNVISESYDNSTQTTTQWVDLDGDGRPDMVRRRDTEGKLIDERTIDKLGGVITGANFDATTGVEIRYVDTDGDGKPDIVRRYGRDGLLIDERSLNGTLIESDFKSETGVTTEWIDLDGDGKPDLIRTIDRNGQLIEERDAVQEDLGQALGQSLDEVSGNTTFFVDSVGNAQVDLELECDPEGNVVAENTLQTTPIGLIGFLGSFSYLPICWGIFLSLLTLTGVMLVSSWCWGGGPSTADLFRLLRQYLHALNNSGDPKKINEAREFLLGIRDQILKWEDGGLIADINRADLLKKWNMYVVPWWEVDRTESIDECMDTFEGLIDTLKAMAVFSFALELIVSLLGSKLPGWIGAAKAIAEMANLKKILEMIKVYERIDNIKGKTEQIKAILEEIRKLREIEGQIPGTDDSIGLRDAQAPTHGPRGQLARVFTGIVTQPVSLVRGCSPIILIASIAGILGFLGLLLFALFGGFRAPATTVESTPVVEEALQEETLVEEPEFEPPTATPAPTPTLTPFELVMNFGHLTEEQKAQLAIANMLDPEGDWIYSIAAQMILRELAQTDITGYLGIWLHMSQGAVDSWFNNSYYPCNSEIPGGYVACTETTMPVPEGRVLLLAMELAEDVPLDDPVNFYTYAAVLDGDGNPDNNFRYNPPYDWDYFQNTDRWYTLDWNPDLSTWTLNVADVAKQSYSEPSGAHAVLLGRVVAFFIPEGELSAANPGFRMSAFGHDGTYSLEQASGDVTGTDPTEALTTPYPAPITIE